jgi:hypothetical protein
MVVHSCNPGFLRGRDWEDHCSRQKVSETPSQQNKLGEVVYNCNTSYEGGIG